MNLCFIIQANRQLYKPTVVQKASNESVAEINLSGKNHPRVLKVNTYSGSTLSNSTLSLLFHNPYLPKLSLFNDGISQPISIECLHV